jgi:hypothetical protein
MNKLSSFLLILTLLACNEQKQRTKTASKFKIPVVLTHKRSYAVSYFEDDCISSMFPPFVRKYRFSDTIFLDRKYEKNDSAIAKDYFYEKWYHACGDTVRSDGFEVFPDYKTKLNYNKWNEKDNYYYPVYIVNQTISNKLFIAKDSYFFGIQEALDSNYNWSPIEKRGFDFCGNGYYGLKIHPGEFALCLFPVYKGTYKTKIRVRISIGDNIYVSAPFEGTINYNQFHFNKKEYDYKMVLDEPLSNIFYNFYGAIPLDLREKNFALHAVVTN